MLQSKLLENNKYHDNKKTTQSGIDSKILEKDKRTILFSLDVAVKSPVYWINK